VTNPLFDALIAPHTAKKAAFLELDDGTNLRYDQFVLRAAQMAHVLADAGVEPGDRVAVQAPKLPDTIALYAGSLQAGAVYLPLNTAYTHAELGYFIKDATPKVIVCDARDEISIARLADPVGAKVLTLHGRAGSLSRAADASPTKFPTRPRGPQDLAALLYTSGTTGRPKGAMLSHKNLLSNAETLTDLWRITSTDRLIHALPVFQTHGLFVALNTSLKAGGRVRLMERFDLEKIIAEVPQSTLMMGVPTFYTRLLGDTRFGKELTTSMRVFISGSAPLLAETHHAFEARTGHRILERYGMTETDMIASNPCEGDRMAGTVGFALRGTEVQITDPATGTPLPSGAAGMIEVRGDNVFSGYWNMPEKTGEELRDNGFFLTGDLGTQDADGRITIVGRARDLIISGGYNIYPKEIEGVLNDMDRIRESAVFGVPHADFGESVIAALVAEDGVPVATNSVQAEVEAQLARFKHPRKYLMLDALPRNTMGKVQKNVLRETYNA